MKPNTTTRDWRPGVFYLDAYSRTFQGYTCGEDWNGWATPVFEKQAILSMIEVMGDGDDPLSFNDTLDAAAWYSSDWQETTHYKAESISVGERMVTVYPVGTYEWTWVEQS